MIALEVIKSLVETGYFADHEVDDIQNTVNPVTDLLKMAGVVPERSDQVGELWDHYKA